MLLSLPPRMPFNRDTFAAETALRLIPTEQLPAVAQNAMEAGYDGPAVVRMAILDPQYLWAIDQALPAMLAELGCHPFSQEEAAMLLATQRAERILSTGEDPLPSLPYFHTLMLSAGHLSDLYELAYLDDEFYLIEENAAEQRAWAIRALENLLFPALREERKAEADAKQRKWMEERERDWPYAFNSPGRRALLRQRLREKLRESRPVWWLLVIAWIILAWASGSWNVTLFAPLVYLPLVALLAYWTEYRRLVWERRDILRRQRYPEEKI